MATIKVTEVRQIHFDENGVGYGIVGKDALEDGAYELPAKFVSNLAARYKLVDGAATDGYPSKSDEQVEEILLNAEAEKAAALVSAKAKAKPVITKLAYMELFTDTELEAIYEGAKSVVALEIYLDKMKVADNIDLSDPRTAAGLQKLVTAGVLKAARVQEILSGAH